MPSSWTGANDRSADHTPFVRLCSHTNATASRTSPYGRAAEAFATLILLHRERDRTISKSHNVIFAY